MMNKCLYKTLAVILALVLTVSAMILPVSAEELSDESGEAAIAEVGYDAPAITSLRSTAEGVRMEWAAINGINLYRVERYYEDGRGWQQIATTDKLYHVDKNVTSGNTYRYRLYGVNANGGVLTTTATDSVKYTQPAQVNDAQTVSNGVRIYWSKNDGVGRVAVYRMNNNNWTRIAESSDTSYLDKNVSYGNEYRYTVRALTNTGEFADDGYDEIGFSHRYLKTPALRVSNDAGGVRLNWDKIDGAEGYRIFYRNSEGDWKRMESTTQNTLLDTDVRSGNNYTYTVRCITGDGERYTSYFDTAGKSVRYIAAPVLLSAAGTDDGIRISWQASAGASKYRVFYKNSQGSWSRLGDTTGTSMLDTDVRSGVKYTYTVRCLNASGDYISYFYDEGVTGMYLSAPEFTVSNGADGVDIAWKAVPGAVNYRVYYYGSKGWTKLTDTTETSFTDEDVESGYNYTYTVRCINAEGNQFTSGFLPGRKVKYYAAPAITSLTNTEEGIMIKWNAVPGVPKYRVYYYGSKGWTKMVDTADTSYLDDDVSSGYTYTYTVRCLDNEDDFLSYFKPGVKHQFIDAPDFKLTRNDKSITISWDEVKGAELYRVYYRSANGWTKMVDTTETSYEDKDIRSGNTYKYTVRCLNAAADEFTSDFRAGKSMKYVEVPYISSIRGGPEGVELSWSASKGASGYRVYYKTSDGWTKAGETTETSFVHTDAESGKDLTYTVRCVSADGSDFESNFDTVGKTIHYIAAPKNLKAEPHNNSIKISWTHSAGAAKYRVYYYGRNGWTRLAETTDDSVIDDDVASGYTYRYTVRCISADGNSFTSDFNHDGVSCPFTTMPVLQEPDYTKDGIVINWSKSPGAEKYRVYYYGSRGWTKLAETTGTSVIDTDVSSGSNYRYTVRCITADGTAFTSDCDTTGVKVYYVSAPKLVSSDTSSNSLTFTWSSPRGASKYRVYKRINGSWNRITDTTSNSYTDKNVSTGNTYTYTVRVINNSGNEFYSGFDPNGFIITVVSGVDGFVYYDQTKYNYPYGDDTIAYSGCGPTSFAMIASTLTGRSITPVDAVKWCGNSYYLMGVGTYWSYFGDAADYFGITMEAQLSGSNTSGVINALKKGKYVISSQSAGRFTRGGHFIVLAGITSSGRIIVYDPNGGNNYIGTTFTMSEIAEAGTQYWVFDK